MIIKKFRVEAGLTQAQLAAKMGVDQTTVAKWETGKSCPNALDIPVLADVLQCSINDLFGREVGE